jgi:TonB family protein
MRILAAFSALAIALAATENFDPATLTAQAKAVVLQPGGREKAEALLVKAVNSYEKQGSKSEDYAAALTLLAMIRHPSMTGDKDALGTKVEPLARKAVEIRQKDPGVKSADLALDLELESMVLEELGRLDDSRDPKAKARALRDQIILAMQRPGDDTERVEHMGGPDIQPPRLMARAEPLYSFDADVLKLQAEVIAEMVIEADGSVGRVEIYKPAGFGLDEAAVAALLKWRFTPARKNGVPVPVEGTLRLQFQPPGGLRLQ